VSVPELAHISPVADKLLEYCALKSIPVVVDSKKPWWVHRSDFTAVLPNEIEWNAVKVSPEDLSLTNPHVSYIITRGAGGISLYRGSDNINLPAFAENPVDVIGAGDSVTAAFMVRYLDDVTDKELMRFVNAAGAAAVSNRGTHAVTLNEILSIYERNLLWQKESELSQKTQRSNQ
jgi:bifunctional ADP-heptose synthase (sugar kinase/adenylyltransferase)